MLEHNELYGVILAFDVKVERDALELAESSGIKIFTADIIYPLFDKFQGFKEDLKQKAKDKPCHVAMFPCKLRIMPNCIFNFRDPIIISVRVAGIVKSGKQSCVPLKEGLIRGTIVSLQANNRPVDVARQGIDVCIKIENTNGEAPKLYGRHFYSTDLLISLLSRESIDALKPFPGRNDKNGLAFGEGIENSFQNCLINSYFAHLSGRPIRDGEVTYVLRHLIKYFR